jgi:hypothetical protein
VKNLSREAVENNQSIRAKGSRRPPGDGLGKWTNENQRDAVRCSLPAIVGMCRARRPEVDGYHRPATPQPSETFESSARNLPSLVPQPSVISVSSVRNIPIQYQS